MIAICNRNPFVPYKFPRREPWLPLRTGPQQWGSVTQLTKTKIVIQLATGETITDHPKFWSVYHDFGQAAA